MSDDAIDFHDLLIRVSFCEVKLSHYSCPVTLTAAPIWGRYILYVHKPFEYIYTTKQ